MNIPEQVFWIPFVAIAAYVIYGYFKHGGFRGMFYGSAVAKTVGEVEVERKFGVATTLRVYVLENGKIALEHSSRAFLSFSMNGNALSVNDTDKLIWLLQQARA